MARNSFNIRAFPASARNALKTSGGLLKDTVVQWLGRDPFRNSAVISYYTIFSLPGLLVIVINLAGYFFGRDEVANEITSQVESLIGRETAGYIKTIITSASRQEGTTLSSAISIMTILFGATGVFYQVQYTMNIMWEVQPEPRHRWYLQFILDRIFSFGLILAVGFLLLVSLVLSTSLSVLSNWVSARFSDSLVILFRLLDLSVSFAIITLLFASIFKFLPDAEIRWRDVWVGAVLTSALFVVAKFALGFYFGHSDPASAYGAAGSVVLIMLWVTYSSLILLFGAEFTRVYSNRCGGEVQPSEFAESTTTSQDPSSLNPREQKE